MYSQYGRGGVKHVVKSRRIRISAEDKAQIVAKPLSRPTDRLMLAICNCFDNDSNECFFVDIT
jgi:hypothetical protein